MASEHSIRVITYSRPGYAESTPDPGRSVASCAEDVQAIADHLGIDEFVTYGQSGGGPHALATVALLRDRCLAAATIAGAAPSDADDLDFLAGMGPENVEEFSAAKSGEAQITSYLLKEADALATVQGEEVADALGGLICDADRAVLTGEYADATAFSLRRSVSQGIAGWRDDDLAFTRQWGFDLDRIDRPVAVWQGGQDLMVPLAHGHWLGSHVPGAQLHVEPGEGHLSLSVARLGDILDDLLRLSGRR